MTATAARTAGPSPAPTRPRRLQRHHPGHARSPRRARVNAADYEAYGYDAAGNRISLAQARRLGAHLSIRRAEPDDVKIVPERAGLDPQSTRATSITATTSGNRQTYARFDSAARRGRHQRL